MEEKQISINNLKTNYKIAGKGPAVLILHGWGSKSEKWQKAGELLAEKGLKVIIPDLPGFGKTQKPAESWDLDRYSDFIKKLSASLNLEKFYLLGHSFGGAVAVRFSLSYPESVKKLFLAAAACLRKKTLKKRILIGISKIFGFFSFLPFYSFFKKVFYKFIVRKSDYPYYSGIMKETYLKAIGEDLSEKLNLIKIPTVIIWGEDDDVTPIKDARFLEQKIKNSKLMVIPGTGHDLEQEKPEILTQKVIQSL